MTECDSHPRTAWCALAALPWLLVAALVGCHSSGYHAGSLPPQLLAQERPSQRNLQLQNLAANGPNSAVIAPGDLLEVHLASGAEDKPPLPQVTRVGENGVLELPVIGPVRVTGLEPAAASRAVAAAAVERGLYKRPSVTVTVKEQATNKVTVLGAVNDPGLHELPKNASDVLSAIAAAGGLNEEAGIEVEVMRHNASYLASDTNDTPPAAGLQDEGVQPVGYNASQPYGGRRTPDVQRINLAQAPNDLQAVRALGDHDVVMVLPKEKKVIHVTGLVQRPDQFELPDDQPLRLLDALAMAGGTSSQVADKVIVLRQPAGGGDPVAIAASIGAAKKNSRENLVLAPGDFISVETTLATASLQTVKDFFRVTMGVSSRLTAF